jgi:hypothetical protein
MGIKTAELVIEASEHADATPSEEDIMTAIILDYIKGKNRITTYEIITEGLKRPVEKRLQMFAAEILRKSGFNRIIKPRKDNPQRRRIWLCDGGAK